MTNHRPSSKLLKLAVAVALALPTGALAQGEKPELKVTVLKPTGTLKAKDLGRITASVEQAAGQHGVSYADWAQRDADAQSLQSCAADSMCLASEGQMLEADVAVSVTADAAGKGASLTVMIVHVPDATELLRTTIALKRSEYPKAGTKLFAYLDSAEVTSAFDRVLAVRASAAPEPAPAEPAPAAPSPEPVTPSPAATPEQPGAADVSIQTPLAKPEEVVRKPIHVGLSTGVLFSQLQSELGTSFSIKRDGGYAVWRNLSVFGAVAYTQPSVDGDLSDPRLGASDYTTSTTQRELTLAVGALWRLFTPGAPWNAYGGVSARTWLLKTITKGSSGGESFLENQETSTRFGLGATLGGELGIGPGAVFGELDLGGSDLPHAITGDVATTAMAINVGYRLLM